LENKEKIKIKGDIEPLVGGEWTEKRSRNYAKIWWNCFSARKCL